MHGKCGLPSVEISIISFTILNVSAFLPSCVPLSDADHAPPSDDAFQADVVAAVMLPSCGSKNNKRFI